MKGVLVLQATVHDLNGINMIQGVRMGGRSQRLHSVRVHLTPLLLVCGETECMSVAYGGLQLLTRGGQEAEKVNPEEEFKDKIKPSRASPLVTTHFL